MLSQSLSLTDCIELAVVQRSGFIESRHIGVAIVLGPDGSTVAEYGNANALILPRSTLKPLQTIACVTAGAALDGVELAMATASHSGTAEHVTVVESILAAASLTPQQLGCPAAWPTDKAARTALVRTQRGPEPIYMNCSGKHAAMLRACLASGWPLANYLDPAHPLQQHIREVVQRFTGEGISHTAIDGCGAPVYAMTVKGLARAIQRLALASPTSPFALHRVSGRLIAAARQFPWAIDGPNLPDDLAIEHLGVFAKSGAEGVMTMAAADGTTAVVKVLDGQSRAATLIAASLLAKAGAVSAESLAKLIPALPLEVFGGGAPVGKIQLSANLI